MAVVPTFPITAYATERINKNVCVSRADDRDCYPVAGGDCVHQCYERRHVDIARSAERNVCRHKRYPVVIHSVAYRRSEGRAERVRRDYLRLHASLRVLEVYDALVRLSGGNSSPSSRP